MYNLKKTDLDVYNAILAETKRQNDNLELIASENFVSPAVLEAQGSVLTNKYAEGYPGKRYYGGCEYVDIAEQLAIDRAKALFTKEPANMKLLVVVDKLLTGFDAPHCTYLYIDKSMQDHGLFQAICRVNRLDGEDKDFGYIVDGEPRLDPRPLLRRAGVERNFPEQRDRVPLLELGVLLDCDEVDRAHAVEPLAQRVHLGGAGGGHRFLEIAVRVGARVVDAGAPDHRVQRHHRRVRRTG